MIIAAASTYNGIFFSEASVQVMKSGNIISPGGSPAELMATLMTRLANAELAAGEAQSDTDTTLASFYDYVRRGLCTLGSPLLTNVAAKHQTLGSCTAVPLRIDTLSDRDLDLAEAYYRLNMGSGYNLSAAEDPCAALVRLNSHAARVDGSGACERYVGNMAHLDVRHPRILDFIAIKTARDDIVHFNTSVNVTHAFMSAVDTDANFELLDGTVVRADTVWQALVDAAWKCGDPGILSLERYNDWNPLAHYSPYVTTAPCAEVGLAPGESCVFGYINIAACIKHTRVPTVDLELVGEVAECLTRVLDDAIEASFGGYPSRASASVMANKRKVGIGVCGFADALLWLGIDYGSERSESLLADVLATINFRSKVASHRLASRRGSFGLFRQSAYVKDGAFLERFGRVPTVVEPADWRDLGRRIREGGLRNVMTTALPPSGRSALLLGVSPSIEPLLSAVRGEDYPLPIAALMSLGLVTHGDQGPVARLDGGPSSWPTSAASPTSLFRTAKDVLPDEHLRVLGVAAAMVDDGVSKTINLPHECTTQVVDRVLRRAWTADLKAVSVYRLSSRSAPVCNANVNENNTEQKANICLSSTTTFTGTSQ